MLTFRLVDHGSAEYNQTVALRDEVLRRPLGMVFSPEQLAAETEDLHLAGYDDEKLVACLVLTPKENGEIKMRQVAVDPERQGTGIGRQLVEESEKIARAHGHHTITLNARNTAIPFYNKLGYRIVGEGFTEVGIPHHQMKKALPQ